MSLEIGTRSVIIIIIIIIIITVLITIIMPDMPALFTIQLITYLHVSH